MSKVSVRYYRVFKQDDSAPDLHKVLKKISKKDLKKRERKIGDQNEPSTVRLENFQKGTNNFFGEIVKIDTDNWPMEVDDDGLKALEIDGNLGYSICFAYNKKLAVIAIQFNPTIISIGRLSQYLQTLNSLAKYNFHPVLKESAWDEFKNGTIKKFSVKVACPNSFAGIGGDGLDGTIQDLASTYSAPYISIELSVGNKKGNLDESLKSKVKRILTKQDVLSMSAKTLESSQSIDLMNYVLQDYDHFNIGNDPKKSYSTKVSFVRRSLNKNLPFMTNLFQDQS